MEDDKIIFLRRLLHSDAGPDEMLRMVLKDYQKSSEKARINLVGALMTELSAHVVIPKLIAGI